MSIECRSSSLLFGFGPLDYHFDNSTLRGLVDNYTPLTTNKMPRRALLSMVHTGCKENKKVL